MEIAVTKGMSACGNILLSCRQLHKSQLSLQALQSLCCDAHSRTGMQDTDGGLSLCKVIGFYAGSHHVP